MTIPAGYSGSPVKIALYFVLELVLHSLESAQLSALLSPECETRSVTIHLADSLIRVTQHSRSVHFAFVSRMLSTLISSDIVQYEQV